MWRAAYPSAYVFKTIFTTIPKIVEDLVFEITREGVVIRRMEEKRVVFIRISIPSGVFKVWHYERDYEIGVSAALLARVFKNAKKYEKVEFLVEDDEFKIILYDPEHPVDAKTFVIKQLSLEEPFTLPKDLKNDVYVEFLPEFYVEIIKGATSIKGENLKITTHTQSRTVKFSTETELGERYEYVLDLEKSKYVTQYEIRNDAESEYSLHYLSKIVNIAKIADIAKIEYSTKLPLMIHFLISQIHFQYVQAPRVL